MSKTFGENDQLQDVRLVDLLLLLILPKVLSQVSNVV